MQRTSNKSFRGGAALHHFGRCDRVLRESCRWSFLIGWRFTGARLDCKAALSPGKLRLELQNDVRTDHRSREAVRLELVCRFAGRSNRSCGDGVACAESGVRSQRRHAHFIHANRHGQQARARPCILLCHVCFERTLRTAGRLHFGSTTRHQLPSSRRHLPSFQQQVRLL